MKVSKMTALGFRNPFAKEVSGGSRKTIQFRTMRGHRYAKTKDGETEIDKRTYDLTFSVPGVDSIIVPVLDDNGKPIMDGEYPRQQEARIAYVPGAQSIFVEEIMEYMGFREHKEVLELAEPINFFNERLDCEPHEINKVAYLRASNLCLNVQNDLRKGNPSFYEYDPVRIADETVKRSLADSKATRMVEELIENDSKTTLWALFSERKDLTIAEAKKRFSFPEITNMVLGYAKEQPVEFMRSLKDPKRMDRIYILQALNDGLLTEYPDGSVKNQKGETVAIVGLGGKAVDAVYSQMSSNSPEHLQDLRVMMGKKFQEISAEQTRENEEIRRLKAEIEKLKAVKEIADNVDADKLKKVVGQSVTFGKAESVIRGLAANGQLKIVTNRWVKNVEGGDILPPVEANEGKTWCLKTLPKYYTENPGEYKELLGKL